MSRRDTWRRLRSAPIRRILVVCYGNIYRSAYVGAILGRTLGPTVEVRSAGFHQKTGRASPERLQLMTKERGIDLADHRSRVVQRADLDWADTIVLMDRHNWQRLMSMGAARDRFVWLGAFDAGAPEVADPYNLDDTATEAVVSRLQHCAARMAARIATAGASPRK